jgi:hypothetical protein
LSEEPRGFENLSRAFKDGMLENTTLEQLGFNGVYENILAHIFGSRQEYFVGIRGNNTRAFDIFGIYKNKNVSRSSRFRLRSMD